ncbi:hypothetical protein L1987_27272 [Smallanthus sonchifolius]|uniref:Uncharacterized protein n=1 Tax=Smallanthus sonchifolius TaxID=185202 RepID=A0ACB9IB19_9ASTR|nr:hypothetical protein L1987_27272 [Smallanthus sonchifolius]
MLPDHDIDIDEQCATIGTNVVTTEKTNDDIDVEEGCAKIRNEVVTTERTNVDEQCATIGTDVVKTEKNNLGKVIAEQESKRKNPKKREDRKNVKSLQKKMLSATLELNFWVQMLNYKERFRSDSSQHRLFVNTKAIEKRMERFRNNMKAAVNGDEKLADLKAFDMVLFLILKFNHYYLLKEIFVDYLEEKTHPKTDEIAATNIHKVKLEWATTNNYTDCGVFLMRHMERFMGLHEMFECGFSKNGRKKLTELKRLRKKMVAHILLSPANVLKEKVRAEALKKGKVVAAVQYF